MDNISGQPTDRSTIHDLCSFVDAISETQINPLPYLSIRLFCHFVSVTRLYTDGFRSPPSYVPRPFRRPHPVIGRNFLLLLSTPFTDRLKGTCSGKTRFKSNPTGEGKPENLLSSKWKRSSLRRLPRRYSLWQPGLTCIIESGLTKREGYKN